MRELLTNHHPQDPTSAQTAVTCSITQLYFTSLCSTPPCQTVSLFITTLVLPPCPPPPPHVSPLPLSPPHLSTDSSNMQHQTVVFHTTVLYPTLTNSFTVHHHTPPSHPPLPLPVSPPTPVPYPPHKHRHHRGPWWAAQSGTRCGPSCTETGIAGMSDHLSHTVNSSDKWSDRATLSDHLSHTVDSSDKRSDRATLSDHCQHWQHIHGHTSTHIQTYMPSIS